MGGVKRHQLGGGVKPPTGVRSHWVWFALNNIRPLKVRGEQNHQGQSLPCCFVLSGYIHSCIRTRNRIAKAQTPRGTLALSMLLNWRSHFLSWAHQLRKFKKARHSEPLNFSRKEIVNPSEHNPWPWPAFSRGCSEFLPSGGFGEETSSCNWQLGMGGGKSRGEEGGIL